MSARNYVALSYLRKWYEWHQEDAWRVSQRHPIYVIADGVTQKVYLNLNPPLGPKAVAEIFCRRTIKSLEDSYARLSKKAFAMAYTLANQAIKKRNDKTGSPCATVGATVVIKRGRLYAARAADCGFVVVRAGKIFFKTPEFWSANLLSKRDNYARLDGEFPVADYLDYFHCKIRAGDILILYTDGFEPHWERPDFPALFTLDNFSKLKKLVAKYDVGLQVLEAEKYGSERTLLAVKL